MLGSHFYPHSWDICHKWNTHFFSSYWHYLKTSWIKRRHPWTITARQMSTDFLPINLHVHSWAGLSCQWLSFTPFILHTITHKKEFKKKPEHFNTENIPLMETGMFWHIAVFFQKLPSLKTSFQMPYMQLWRTYLWIKCNLFPGGNQEVFKVVHLLLYQLFLRILQKRKFT